MFGIFKRIRELEQVVQILTKQRHFHSEYQRLADEAITDANKARLFRLTVRPGWQINDSYWRTATVLSVARTGILVSYPDHTEVLKWGDITDAYPPEQALTTEAK